MTSKKNTTKNTTTKSSTTTKNTTTKSSTTTKTKKKPSTTSNEKDVITPPDEEDIISSTPPKVAKKTSKKKKSSDEEDDVPTEEGNISLITVLAYYSNFLVNAKEMFDSLDVPMIKDPPMKKKGKEIDIKKIIVPTGTIISAKSGNWIKGLDPKPSGLYRFYVEEKKPKITKKIVPRVDQDSQKIDVTVKTPKKKSASKPILPKTAAVKKKITSIVKKPQTKKQPTKKIKTPVKKKIIVTTEELPTIVDQSETSTSSPVKKLSSKNTSSTTPKPTRGSKARVENSKSAKEETVQEEGKLSEPILSKETSTKPGYVVMEYIGDYWTGINTIKNHILKMEKIGNKTKKSSFPSQITLNYAYKTGQNINMFIFRKNIKISGFQSEKYAIKMIKKMWVLHLQRDPKAITYFSTGLPSFIFESSMTNSTFKTNYNFILSKVNTLIHQLREHDSSIINSDFETTMDNGVKITLKAIKPEDYAFNQIIWEDGEWKDSKCITIDGRNKTNLDDKKSTISLYNEKFVISTRYCTLLEKTYQYIDNMLKTHKPHLQVVKKDKIKKFSPVFV
uniref:Uncharacterized protein n=1 Tax=viral metagenome TaxID=1070528 RepID=A0A6C0JRH9_9ZZZZ